MRSIFAPAQKYIGTGVVNQYAFDFKVEALGQLLIVVYDATGVEVQRLRGDQTPGFVTSVQFDPEVGGGTVNLAANLPAGYNLYLFQANDAPTQPSEFREKSSFTLRSFERALDFIMGPVQRLAWLSGRSIRLNDGFDAPFNMQMPRTLIPTASLIIGADGLSFFNGPTTAQLAQASADALAAGLSAGQAAASAAAALISEQNAAISATTAAANNNAAVIAANAALASENAAVAAQAAAELAAQSAQGFVVAGPFTVNASTNQNLAGQTFDSALHRAIDFFVWMKDGANILSRVEFSIAWNGTAWVKFDGPERHYTDIPNVEFNVSNPGTGQINVNNLGATNVNLKIQKLYHFLA